MEIAGITGAEARSRKLLDEVGLSERTHHYPSQLSGGEQQRVALARALANEPPILLADEPTGNLDAVNGQHIVQILLDIHERRGTTIVLATHDLELAGRAGRILVLKRGRIEQVDERSGVVPLVSAASRG
jgi:putative ABC transport system ATP-binding protein